MSLTSRLKAQLRNLGIRPSHRLGQSFMVDEAILQRLAAYGQVSDTDSILEFGAGLGFLTEVLACKAKHVFAVEYDKRLADFLTQKFAGRPNVEVIRQDFFKLNLSSITFNKIISNPPFEGSSTLIFRILEAPLELAVFTLQQEFAERLVAKPGSKDYSRLTVMVSLKADCEILEIIPPKVFYPQPEVYSAIVRMQPRKSGLPSISDFGAFQETLRVLFTQRNRTVRRALKTYAKLKKNRRILEDLSAMPFLDRRVFTLTPENLIAISNAISASS